MVKTGKYLKQKKEAFFDRLASLNRQWQLTGCLDVD